MGYTPSQCLDFDFAVLDFWTWVQNKRAEKVQVRQNASNTVKDKHVLVDKYHGDGEILKLYYDWERESGKTLDPIVAALSDADLAQLLEDWETDIMQ